jgi:hypothetical protein
MATSRCQRQSVTPVMLRRLVTAHSEPSLYRPREDEDNLSVVDRRVPERAGAELLRFYCHRKNCLEKANALRAPRCPKHGGVMKPVRPPWQTEH